jgi:hypothetical protein
VDKNIFEDGKMMKKTLFLLLLLPLTAYSTIYYSLVCESGISGTYWTGLTAGQKVRYTNGADSCVYSTPDAWDNARDRDLGSDTEVCEIAGTWTNGMTTNLLIEYSSWVNTSPYQLVVRGVGDSRAGSQWSTSAFRFAPSSGYAVTFSSSCNMNMSIENLQFDCSTAGTGAWSATSWSSGNKAIIMNGCIVSGSNGEYTAGVYVANNHNGEGAPYATSVTAYLINNIVFGFTGATIGEGFFINTGGGWKRYRLCI